MFSAEVIRSANLVIGRYSATPSSSWNEPISRMCSGRRPPNTSRGQPSRATSIPVAALVIAGPADFSLSPSRLPPVDGGRQLRECRFARTQRAFRRPGCRKSRFDRVSYRRPPGARQCFVDFGRQFSRGWFPKNRDVGEIDFEHCSNGSCIPLMLSSSRGLMPSRCRYFRHRSTVRGCGRGGVHIYTCGLPRRPRRVAANREGGKVQEPGSSTGIGSTGLCSSLKAFATGVITPSCIFQ